MRINGVKMEKRKFSRVKFNAEILIKIDEYWIKCDLLDISLKGILLTVEEPYSLDMGKKYDLKIKLPSSTIVLSFEGRSVHKRESQFGLRFENFDSDSFTHLRRLLELNTGEDQLIRSEISHLIDQA